MNEIVQSPKILFIVNGYGLSGICKSLSSLLSIAGDYIDADVFAFGGSGIENCDFPKCHILQPVVFLSRDSSGMTLFQKIIHKISIAINNVSTKILKKDLTPFYITLGGKRIHSESYDYIVCYSEAVAKYVCHIPAKKRIAWIHCDYQRFLTLRKADETDIYSKFDNVVCVSEFGKKRFDEVFPQFSNRSLVGYNIIDQQKIIESSNTFIPGEYGLSDGFRIVSIGRLDAVKQFYLIPSLAEKIRSACSRKFVWYIIGDGTAQETDRVKKEIERYRLDGTVKLIGPKKNVYPYIYNSNLLVNTSLSEAYSLVNNEAKALGIPVVTNNFECAAETIVDGNDGRIVSIDELGSTIADIMLNKYRFEPGETSNQQAITNINRLFCLCIS